MNKLASSRHAHDDKKFAILLALSLANQKREQGSDWKTNQSARAHYIGSYTKAEEATTLLHSLAF